MLDKNRYADAISKSYSYTSYRKLVTDLYTNKKNTGTNHSEDYLNHTNMNIRRMDRLDKKGELLPETIQLIESITAPMTWLTLTEGWCADAAQSLPFISKMAEINPAIDLKLILRDENLDIMDAHQYHGTRSIPRMIMLDTATLQVLGQWGPRPEAAQSIVNQAKADKAKSNDGAVKALIDYEKNKNMQLWYKKDKGISLQEEINNLLVKTQLVVQ